MIYCHSAKAACYVPLARNHGDLLGYDIIEQPFRIGREWEAVCGGGRKKEIGKGSSWVVLLGAADGVLESP